MDLLGYIFVMKDFFEEGSYLEQGGGGRTHLHIVYTSPSDFSFLHGAEGGGGVEREKRFIFVSLFKFSQERRFRYSKGRSDRNRPSAHLDRPRREDRRTISARPP